MKTMAIILIGICLTINTFAQNGSLLLKFDNVIGNEDLKLNSEIYTNAAGEKFSVSLFQYYISNIKLKAKDGSEYVVPQDESYFLVREAKPESQQIMLNNIPKGKYVGVSFTIGVDSLRNTLPIARRGGCLDVGGEGKDMYWAWNSGYIFMKMEGQFVNSLPDSAKKTKEFLYHIGLFGGMKSPTLNNIRATQVSFGEKKLKLKANSTPEIIIQVDAAQVFSGSTKVSLVQKPEVMGTPYSSKIADNYARMFRLGSIEAHKNTESSKVTLGMK